jgi:hypothetical protein
MPVCRKSGGLESRPPPSAQAWQARPGAGASLYPFARETYRRKLVLRPFEWQIRLAGSCANLRGRIVWPAYRCAPHRAWTSPARALLSQPQSQRLRVRAALDWAAIAYADSICSSHATRPLRRRKPSRSRCDKRADHRHGRRRNIRFHRMGKCGPAIFGCSLPATGPPQARSGSTVVNRSLEDRLFRE